MDPAIQLVRIRRDFSLRETFPGKAAGLHRGNPALQLSGGGKGLH
jgi:hypothetical protein